tara:strand:+ start:444 stop:734 length:291 start_codon:yes stop_codon:yes gene_type:complete
MIAQAITNLFGGYSNRDGQDLIVEDRVERLPTTEEQVLIDAETLRLETEATANAYKQKRVAEYPSIGDQLDALFHAGVFPEDMATQIQTVKDNHPK